MIRTIGAGVAVTVCFFYLGCGGVQIANASGGANTAPLTIATKLLPSAIDGTPYVVVLDATGGTPGYTWSITAGKLPAGISLTPTSGIISGTPMVSGNFSVGVTLIDAGSPSEKRTSTVTIAVDAVPLAIVASALPSATDGTPYSQTLQATGGTLPYTWSIATGALPAGIKLGRATGVLSGTPTAVGASSFSAAIHDSGHPAQSQSIAMNLTAAPAALKVITSTMPSAVGGVHYSQTLRASGGTPGYTWTIASGNLPAGLTLAQATGVISGTPTSSSTAIFTASVGDSSNSTQALSAPITIVVAATPLKITAPVLPSVIVGTAYSQGLQVVGGTAPYAWSIASGQLPAGLALTSSTGAISGTPTAIGPATFTATVTDSSIPVRSASTTTKVIVTSTPLAILPAVLPSVRVGAPYSQAMQASGGTSPYRWSIASGNLPSGLNLAPSTGTISGTPTTSGTANFTATVTDSGTPIQSAAAAAAVVVSTTPLIITCSSLPTATAGAAYSHTMMALGGNQPYAWSITKGILPSGLTLAPSTGIISGTPTGSGPFTVTTTVMDGSNPAQGASTTTALLVVSTTLKITPKALPATTPGSAYSQTLMATGGVAPYAWSITSGRLPAGLSISQSTGVISGTPTTGGISSFTAAVSDSSSPVQVYAAGMTIAGTNVPLTITSSSLPSGTGETFYSQSLQASGGTPAYTWSITSGSLPTGLTLASTTGTISGTPTASGTSNFTATVTDNGSPAQTQSAANAITVAGTPPVAGLGTTWFIRTDGGTRFSANVPLGQCDGQADVAYPGSGLNQHCAFNDFRYMWDDNSGQVGSGTWVMAGGDTVLIRGCTANSNQTNPSNPNCRIGWDVNWGGGPTNLWCQGIGNQNCFNPPIPAGTATAHTRILGQCVLAGNCNTGNVSNRSNLSQIFGGMGVNYTLNLESTKYLDIEGIELTSHNGVCTTQGGPAGPRTCNRNSPVDDYASSGFLLNNSSAAITFQDVYVHGFNSSGFFGPIGGAITMTRVFSGFNAFSGWNFDDGSTTPDAPGSSITASYVTMIGNGCYEQYPVVNSFSASACYDDVAGGFGDAWSGQDTELDSFICDHCVMAYNTKDGFIGPHTNVKVLTVTNSESYGNMGAQWKWNNSPNSTTTFMNNLTVGNCARFQAPIPGASQSFALSSGLPGAYLSDYCRAAGNTVAINSQQNSSVLFANNTFVDYVDTVILLSCGPSTNNRNGMCGTTPFVFTNNIFLGYTLSGQEAPGLYYIDDRSITVTQNNNVYFGNRPGTGETCDTNGNICSDPLLVGEPLQQVWTNQTFLDNFNFYPSRTSPAIAAGAAYNSLLATDYYGNAWPTPPTIGAVKP